ALVLAVVTGLGVWVGSWGGTDGDRAVAVGTDDAPAAVSPTEPGGEGGNDDNGDSGGADDGGDAQGDAAGDDGSEEDEGAQEEAAIWQRDPVPNELPSDTTALEPVDYLTGGMTPKSIMASGHGLMIANNMMYSHTSTVFDSTTREQVAVLDDAVDLSEFGVEGHPGVSEGSPVEAVWTDDGRYAYVSQYTMYGQNFGVQGFDACTRESGVGA